MFAKRFRKQKSLLIMIPADILLDKWISYTDSKNCFIAQSIRRQFGVQDVSVTPERISINEINYRVLGGAGFADFLESFRRSSLDYWQEKEGFLTIPLERLDN